MTNLRESIKVEIKHNSTECFIQEDGILLIRHKQRESMGAKAVGGLVGFGVVSIVEALTKKSKTENQEGEQKIKWSEVSEAVFRKWNRHLKLTYDKRDLWVVVKKTDFDRLQKFLELKLGDKFKVEGSIR